MRINLAALKKVGFVVEFNYAPRHLYHPNDIESIDVITDDLGNSTLFDGAMLLIRKNSIITSERDQEQLAERLVNQIHVDEVFGIIKANS